MPHSPQDVCQPIRQISFFFFFSPCFAGNLGIGRVFDFSAITLVLILRLVGIYRRRQFVQRVRRLAAMEHLEWTSIWLFFLTRFMVSNPWWREIAVNGPSMFEGTFIRLYMRVELIKKRAWCFRSWERVADDDWLGLYTGH